MTGNPEQIPDEVVDKAHRVYEDTYESHAVRWRDDQHHLCAYDENVEAFRGRVFSGTKDHCEKEHTRLAMRAALSVYEAYRSQLLPITAPKEVTNGLD